MSTNEDLSDLDTQSYAQTYVTNDTGNPDNRIIWSDDPENAYLRTLVDPEDTSMLDDSYKCRNAKPTHIVDTSGMLYDTDADDTVARIEPDQQETDWFEARRAAVNKLNNQAGGTSIKTPVSALSVQDRAGDGRDNNEPFAVPNRDLMPIPNGDSSKIIPGIVFVSSKGSAAIETATDIPQNSKTHHGDTLSPEDRRRKLSFLQLIIVGVLFFLVIGIVVLSIVFKNKKDKANPGPPPVLTDSPSVTPLKVVTPLPSVSPTDAPTSVPSTRPSRSPIAPGSTYSPTVSPSAVPTMSPTVVTTPSPTDDPFGSIQEMLSSTFPDSASDLNDPAAPQYQALDWLANDEYTLALLDLNRVRGRSLEELNSRVSQRWVLATIYYSTGGESAWKNTGRWLTSTNECDWAFVSSCDNNGAIQELAIEDNELAGSLPREIGNLGETLLKLSLNSNSIGGSLPSTLGLLTGVTRMTIQANDLEGRLPMTLGNMVALEFLAMRGNDFTGPMPTQLGNLEHLRTLDLAVTDISGSIPSQLSSCAEMELISLGSTKVSGTIPSALGGLTLLRDFAAARTDLTGSVPDGFCDGAGLDSLRMDCREVSCPCCTQCCTDGGSCDGATPAPSPRPTRSPTSSPTKNPTPRPTVYPTTMPTVRPATVATALPTIAPTVEPTRHPTRSPTRGPATDTPTKYPTREPTKQATDVPTKSPTNSPNSPTYSPTRATYHPTSTQTRMLTPHPTTPPTSAPVDFLTPPPTSGVTVAQSAAGATSKCASALSTELTCYENGQDVVVSFVNCDPQSTDWVGVYAADQEDWNNLKTPLSWVWLSGDQANQATVESGKVTFYGAAGSGAFQIVLAREDQVAPVQAYAVSNVWTLTRDTC
eukprot:Nitzschia sp. Nitz4//NODE_159_length_47236_cov_74.723851//5205//7823//NITZ4_additional_000003-RA//-1//CDS//3329531728//6372//frame0